MAQPGTFHGKYRGTVINNVDPLRKGRLLVQVSDVLGDVPSSWALPCLPLAGPQLGHFVLPIPGTGVWVEFEQGNPDFPIWVGCWYGSSAEVPALALSGTPAAPNVLMQTVGQRGVLLSDTPGGMGISLISPTGGLIQINDQGILITNGKGASITMVGTTVTVNSGALVVV
jgi:uncharacterized protein involved in type VI secretion and phage assembly